VPTFRNQPVAAVRNTAFIQLMCGLYSDSGTLPRKLRAKLRNLEGLAGAKDLMVRSMRLRNHIGVELTDPNLRLSGFWSAVEQRIDNLT
jgi:hypothetical protein